MYIHMRSCVDACLHTIDKYMHELATQITIFHASSLHCSLESLGRRTMRPRRVPSSVASGKTDFGAIPKPEKSA